MSGPTTVSFSFFPLGAILLAGEAIREARAMGREYAQALENVKARESALAAERRRHAQALAERQAAAHGEAERQERRLERLKDVCAAIAQRAQRQDMPPLPELTRPAARDRDALMRYADALHAASRAMEEWLASNGTAFAEEALRVSNATGMPAVDDMLNTYALRRALSPGLSDEQTARLRDTAARILARLELAPGAVVPRELETLAGDILLSATLERAEELASELRFRVQQHRNARASREQDMESAQELLEALQDDAPEELRERLLRAAAGQEPLDADTRQAAERVLAAMRQAHERQEQEAAALVLEQSLLDLGYEVDGVENTLFVEGGVAHFQRPGWDDYFVRLRLNADEKTINFNVVRPRGGEEGDARRRLDMLAEDRWCTEMPRLIKTLAARGLAMNVTRLLGAGELPVQAVDPATLPVTRAEEAQDRQSAPQQKSWPES